MNGGLMVGAGAWLQNFFKAGAQGMPSDGILRGFKGWPGKAKARGKAKRRLRLRFERQIEISLIRTRRRAKALGPKVA